MGVSNCTIPIEFFLSKIEARRCGSGWSAKCPAHEDSTASLSISEGDDRRVLLHCHAGCKPEAICRELGIELHELFPEDAGQNRHNPRKTRESEGFRRQKPQTENAKPTFLTLDDAVAEYEKRSGKASARWLYEDADGKIVGCILRWNHKDGSKDIRPVALENGKWVHGGMPEPRPIYNRTSVSSQTTVYLVEGEKCADALATIGIVATTSAHGAKSADKTDWSPLAGKDVVILPDADKSGLEYADNVVALLSKLSPQPKIRIVELPGLEPKEDIFDWLEKRDAAEPDDLRAELCSIVDAVAPLKLEAESSDESSTLFMQFPTDQLPCPLDTVVRAYSAAIGCDESFIALPLLAVLSSAISSTRRLTIKRGWSVPPMLWTVNVGNSGSGKSPAFTGVLKPLRDQQRKAMETYAECYKQYEVEQQLYKVEQARWDKKPEGDPPLRPTPPIAERFFVDNTTVEALLTILDSNVRHPLLAKDELSGWFAGFDAYRGGKGGDEAFWLSAFNGDSYVNDRKTGPKANIYLPHVCLAVTGGIQPEILKRHLTADRRESGLASRLLMAFPPQRSKVWNDDEIDSTTETLLSTVVNGMRALEPEVDSEGRVNPVCIGMSAEAKELFKKYFNSHNQEQAELRGDLAAAWSKLEQYAARIALTLHYARVAVSDFSVANDNQVDAESMGRAIAITEWFKSEAKRIYKMLHESPEDQEQRRLCEWIQRKGGRITPRELQRTDRNRYPTAEDAEQALEALVKSKHGKWVSVPSGPQGGRPSREFVLSLHPTQPR